MHLSQSYMLIVSENIKNLVISVVEIDPQIV